MQTMSETAFRDFLKTEMKTRNFTSHRDLAAFLEIDQALVSKVMSERSPRKPGLKFLVHVAEKTGKSIQELMAMIYPDLSERTEVSPSTKLLAQQIEQSPQHIQDAIKALLRDAR